jgi:branched-chain amino acid transport system permease protein
MTELFGIPIQALFGQLMLGLVNGSFYAMLSLGLAVIFGLLGVVNFAHGALYMLGAYVAWFSMDRWGISYWWALLLGPLVVGAVGALLERTLLKRLYKLDPLYGLLLTFGLALIIQGVFQQYYGSSGQDYSSPDALQGATNLGFMVLPNYRGWVIIASLVVCLVTLTYAGGAALAGLAGVLAAPVIQVSPLMGSNLIIIVFAVVVIGGMGSILGSIITGLALGLIEGLTRVFYPEASGIVVFVIMAVVLMIRPAGLFGKEK